jgi:hypothetical protein
MYNEMHLTPHAAPIGQVVTFMEDFWKSLQPTPGASFLDLDKFLLRRAMITQAVEKIQRSQSNNKPPSQTQLFLELGYAYDRMCAAAPTLSYISRDFLVKSSAVEPLIISAAKNKNPMPADPQPVLARATLLLRMATGVTRKLLVDSGYKKGTEFDFWFSSLAVEHGFVKSFSDIDADRSALYDDCAIAMYDMATAFNSATRPTTRSSLFSESNIKTHTVCEVNRIAYWGMQP